MKWTEAQHLPKVNANDISILQKGSKFFDVSSDQLILDATMVKPDISLDG